MDRDERDDLRRRRRAAAARGRFRRRREARRRAEEIIRENERVVRRAQPEELMQAEDDNDVLVIHDDRWFHVENPNFGGDNMGDVLEMGARRRARRQAREVLHRVRNDMEEERQERRLQRLLHLGRLNRQDRERHLQDYENHYFFEAINELNSLKQCQYCEVSVSSKSYVKHLDKCPKSFEDFREKEIVIQRFLAGDYGLNEEIFKLREYLELNYFDFKLNETMVDLECSGCLSVEEHLNGGCVDKHHKQLFEMRARAIKSKYMSLFRKELNMVVEKKFDEMLLQDRSYYDHLPPKITPEMSSDEALETLRQQIHCEIHQKNAWRTEEILKMLATEKKKSIRAYASRKAFITRQIRNASNAMVRYLADNKNRENLREIVAERRAHPSSMELAPGQELRREGNQPIPLFQFQEDEENDGIFDD